MTLPKGARRRRRTTLSAIPKPIADWFAGRRRSTFYAFTPPYAARIDEYWATWKAENPDAVKPKGLDLVIARAPSLRRLMAKNVTNGDE